MNHDRTISTINDVWYIVNCFSNVLLNSNFIWSNYNYKKATTKTTTTMTTTIDRWKQTKTNRKFYEWRSYDRVFATRAYRIFNWYSLNMVLGVVVIVIVVDVDVVAATAAAHSQYYSFFCQILIILKWAQHTKSTDIFQRISFSTIWKIRIYISSIEWLKVRL